MPGSENYNIFAQIVPLARKLELFCNLLVGNCGIPRSNQMQAFCFLVIEGRQRELYQKDLEHAMQIKPSSATAIIRSLEQQGLIERAPDDVDRRLKKIIFTPKALALQEKALAVHRQLNLQLLKNVSPDELEVFRKVCRMIFDNADNSQNS